MKSLIAKPANGLLTFLALLIVNFNSFAQDKKVELEIDTNPGDDASSFFNQPWVWVVGGAIFILLLVALLRGKK